MQKILLVHFIMTAVFLFTGCSKGDNAGNPIDDPSKPNILLIIADDLGLDAMPGYAIGSIKPIMPNIQNLMDRGIKFNNFWSYPTCTPTRSSILTGKHGFRVNVTQVGDVLSTSETSLQQYLTENNTGYSNAVIGKWHLSANPNHPAALGIDYYAGLLQGAASSYNNWNLTENGQTITSTEYITSKISDLAIHWIENQSDPWFLWLAYTAPHTPFHLPPNDLHTQDGLSPDQAEIDANPLPYYMAMIEAMDTEIGRVLASISPSELENTLIIFIGDNGTPSQVAQEYRSQRVKGTVYQGGINVPMIISGRGVGRINQEEDALINATDIFSTIGEIAGVDVSSINDSKSFKGLLNDEGSGQRTYAYSEAGQDSGASDYTIRNQSHKYIKFANGNEALYNLRLNPLENPNLLNANQLPLSSSDEAILEEMIQKLKEIRQ
jgi:arylsulfatase A-like enzyme